MFKGIIYPLTTPKLNPLVENAIPARLFGIDDLTNITVKTELTQNMGWSPTIVSNLEWYRGISFKQGDYFYALGGRTTGGGISDKILFSADMETWEEHAQVCSFGAREGSAYCFHRGYHYMCGGYDGVTAYSDIWRSLDGINWVQVNDGALLSLAYLWSFLSYRGSLYLAGQNKVYRSTDDGLTWGLIQGAAAFGNRSGMAPAVFKDRMYLMGGFIGGVGQNSGYYSTDGITWTLIAAPFASARGSCAAVVLDNTLFVSGGLGVAYYDDIYASTDGTAWAAYTYPTMSLVRGYHALVAYDNKLWFYGGYEGANFVSDNECLSLGTDYYFNGIYIDRTDPAPVVQSDGYYELQALIDQEYKLVRFCMIKKPGYIDFVYFNPLLISSIPAGVEKPIQINPIILTGNWEIEFTCFPLGGYPNEVFGDSTGGDSCVRVDPLFGSVDVGVIGSAFQSVWIFDNMLAVRHYKLVANTGFGQVDVYLDGVFQGSAFTGVPDMQIDTIAGVLNIDLYYGYLWGLVIRQGDGSTVLDMRMDEAMGSTRFFDKSDEMNHGWIIDPLVVDADFSLPFNGDFATTTDGWLPLGFPLTFAINAYDGYAGCLELGVGFPLEGCYQCIATVPGNSYQVTLEIQPTAALNTGRLVVGETPNTSENLNEGGLGTSDAWESYTFTFVATVSQSYLMLLNETLGLTYWANVTLAEHDTRVAVLPTVDYETDAAPGNTMTFKNVTDFSTKTFLIENSLYTGTSTKIRATGALTNDPLDLLFAIQEILDTLSTTIDVGFTADAAPKSAIKSLAKAGISKFTAKLNSRNETDLNVLDYAVIAIYDGDVLVDRVIAGDLNFDSNFLVKVIPGRKIRVENVEGDILFEQYLTLKGV